MSEFSHLLAGFSAALTLKHLTMCFLGVLMGQMVGVLPGIGPAAAIALLLPLTFGADPTSVIILFAGIYYGSQYGGTLTSGLVSVPGVSSNVMSTVEGYQVALQGRRGDRPRAVPAVPRHEICPVAVRMAAQDAGFEAPEPEHPFAGLKVLKKDES